VADLSKMLEEQALKPAFDTAKGLGAVDLYSRKSMKDFLRGTQSIGFVSEVLFNGESIKEKQARLIVYDKEFLERFKKDDDYQYLNFASERQRVEYLESCKCLERSCKKSLELFEQRFLSMISLEEAEERGDIVSHFLERKIFDDNGIAYIGVVDFVGFYCYPEYEIKMMEIIKAQEHAWLDNILNKVFCFENEVEKHKCLNKSLNF